MISRNLSKKNFFYILAGSSNTNGSNQIMVLAENKLTLHDIHALRNGDRSTVISTGILGFSDN